MANVWTDAQRGQVWSDGKKDHVIVGVVDKGFDATCNGVSESFRTAVVEGTGEAYHAEKNPGGARWVNTDKKIIDAVSAWTLKGA